MKNPYFRWLFKFLYKKYSRAGPAAPDISTGIVASGRIEGKGLRQMKAIIPVAGAGTKLRPHTYTQPKALIPLAGKTVLSIIIDQLREAGINEFIFIVGYLGEKIQDYVKVNTRPCRHIMFTR